MLYSRPQLRLLLLVAALFLAGLAVRQWRVGFPDTAQSLERFDREDPAPPLLPAEQHVSPTTTPSASSINGAPRRRDVSPELAPHADADPRPLDINHASVGELARLPGVGPGLAQRIFDERERRGRFDSTEALRRVVGIGPKKLAALRDLVTVGE
jgi:competence ComEA-like helix-hairpin-helix protein